MNIHILAVGGIGMSGIARMIMQLGHRVSGFDINKSYVVDDLIRAGLDFRPLDEVIKGRNIDIVVRSTAISDDNLELNLAIRNNIPIYHRAEMLKLLVQDKRLIAVTGAHGKTTSTSLIAWVLFDLGYSPTAYIGGVLKSPGVNAWIGAGDWAVVELDESDGTFSLFEPEILFIPSLELEHVDFYGSEGELVAFFHNFFNRARNMKVLFGWHSKIGADDFMNDENLFSAENMRFVPQGWDFYDDFSMKIKIWDRKENREITSTIPIIGEHNVYNVCGVLQVLDWIGISPEQALDSISRFPGIDRRVDIYSREPIMVIHDYAHHPTEIKTTLSAIRQVIGDRRMVVVFEPHRYSRFSAFWQEFLSAFSSADAVLITPVYSASEPAIEAINSDRFAFELQRKHNKPAYALISYDIDEVIAAVKSGDCLVVLGAGKVISIAKEISAAAASYQNN